MTDEVQPRCQLLPLLDGGCLTLDQNVWASHPSVVVGARAIEAVENQHQYLKLLAGCHTPPKGGVEEIFDP